MRNAQGAFCKGVNKKMKWFIASDIHGSEYYCKKMLEAFERERADRILLLGDLLYHGPRNDLPKDYSPKAVAALLNGVKEKIFCVRGNCEAEVDQMLLEFPVMADYILISGREFNVCTNKNSAAFKRRYSSSWAHPRSEMYRV